MIDYSRSVEVTLISLSNGRYYNYDKVFNDENHCDNWIDFMIRRGFKYVTVSQRPIECQDSQNSDAK
jgi:hypothetical protein